MTARKLSQLTNEDLDRVVAKKEAEVEAEHKARRVARARLRRSL